MWISRCVGPLRSPSRAKVISITSYDLSTPRQLPERGAVPGGQPGDRGRSAGHAAGPDRGVQTAHHSGPAARHRRARQGAGRRVHAGAERARVEGELTAGTPARLRSSACRRKCGTWCAARTGPSVGGGVNRVWNVDTFYRTMGAVNGGGIGGSMSIAIGAALAHRKQGRLCVRFQPDGDMLYVNSALWTATHHRIPMLIVMQNNRAYHQEVMHLQRMANRRQRGMELAARGLPGSMLTNPNIDFAKMAQSMGAYTEGPISIRRTSGRRSFARWNASRRAKWRSSTPSHSRGKSSGVRRMAAMARKRSRRALVDRGSTLAIRGAVGTRRSTPSRAHPRKRREGQEALRRASVLAVPRPGRPGWRRRRSAPGRPRRRRGRRSPDTCAGRPRR